jgi:hypothetical protein
MQKLLDLMLFFFLFFISFILFWVGFFSQRLITDVFSTLVGSANFGFSNGSNFGKDKEHRMAVKSYMDKGKNI